jgi:peptidoglycan/LPS O-acetylase OafA/YrhL
MQGSAAIVSTSDKPPKETQHRRLDIQGLRAIAVIMVIAFHAGLPVPGGFVGVDVFFVISGFVITGMLQREWLATGRIKFKDFYVKRFKRLIPALALMVTITLLISAVILSPLGPQQTVAKTGIGAILLVANFVIARTSGGYFDAVSETNPLLNTWSLSVEEQFYLIFPAIIAFGWYLSHRAARLRAAPFLFVGLLGVSSFALALAPTFGWIFRGSSTIIGFYSPFPRVWEFAVGALLALATVRGVPWLSRRFAFLAGSVGVGLLAISLWAIDGSTPFPGPWTLLPVAGTLLLILAGTQENSVSSTLSKPPIVKVGDWSYSLYLWHWPFIVFAVYLWPSNPMALILAAAASFAPALASYYWVEQPIRKAARLKAIQWAALIGVTVTVPLIVGGGLWFASQQGWWSDKVRQMQFATLTYHAGSTNGCTYGTPLSENMNNCTWNPNAPGKPIYLLGDSNADHFSEAFIGAGKETGQPLITSTTNGCPFVGGVFRGESISFDNAACLNYFQGSFDYLKSAEPGLIIISNSDHYWASSDYKFGSTLETTVTDSSQKIQSFTRELGKTIKALQGVGHQILLVQSVPHWENPYAWDPRRCTFRDVLRENCTAEQPLSTAQEREKVVRSAIERVAETTDAHIWDAGRDLCPSGTCSTQGPGFITYFDALHISVPQSIELVPGIRRILTNLM